MPPFPQTNPIRRRLSRYGEAPPDVQDPRMVTGPQEMPPETQDPMAMEAPQGGPQEMPYEEGMHLGFSPDSMPTQARAMMMHGPQSFKRDFGGAPPSSMSGLQDQSPMNELHLGQHQIGNKMLRAQRQQKIQALSAIRSRLMLGIRGAKSAADTTNIQRQISQIDGLIRSLAPQADALEQEGMQPVEGQ